MTLDGRTALVTGASRGIGAAIAACLAGAGAKVALVARTGAALDSAAQRIGANATAIRADLTLEESASSAAAQFREKFGAAPDILVNNAGMFVITQLHEMQPAQYESMLRLNLLAPFFLLRSFLPEMRERGSGHVVTIGSAGDRVVFPGNAAYCATKFGARAVHEVLREETRGKGVRATLISPSSVDTDIWEPIQFTDGGTPERSGMMRPAAVAAAVLYAVSQPPNVNVDELRLSRA